MTNRLKIILDCSVLYMYIVVCVYGKTTKAHKGRTYDNYLLVESVYTLKGSRQRTICSLGSLSLGFAEQWHSLALKVKDSLEGQLSLEPVTAQIDTLVEKMQRGRKSGSGASDGYW